MLQLKLSKIIRSKNILVQNKYHVTQFTTCSQLFNTNSDSNGFRAKYFAAQCPGGP